MDDILKLSLDKESNEPLYMQLYKKLKDMIDNSVLIDDEKLPPIRKMSEKLGVNSSTVVNAYKLLESNGYSYSRAGSGIYVIKKGKLRSDLEKSKSEFNITPVTSKLLKKNAIDFSSSTPDSSLFPTHWFKQVLNEVLDREGGQAFGYTEPSGYLPLREVISVYMNNEGIKCNEDSIQIISGAQQGIDIIARAMMDFGDIIITERPTYTGATAVFKSKGAKVLDINIEENGINIEKLERILKDVQPKFIYIMTNFQNPTGYSYDISTKERLLYLAQKYNFYIIEDDYLSELYFGSTKPSTLKSIDKNDRVILIKSFSKIFMPGLRLGYLIVPSKLKERTLAVKHFTDISSSGFMQRVFDLFIRKNMFIDHIRNLKDTYRERYKYITSMLDRRNDLLSYYKSEGGIHLWLKLKSGISSNMLYSYCLQEGLILSPGSIFYADEINSEHFRLSYASTDTCIIEKGTNLLIKNINEMNKINLK